MRILAVKAPDTQALATVFRARQLLVNQRTQLANSIRGMLTEFGVTVAKGLQNLKHLRKHVEESKDLPALAITAIEPMFLTMAQLKAHIDRLTAEMRQAVHHQPATRRLMAIPDIGPITAFAIVAFAGDLAQFKNGREFAAWIGLTPKEHSTGGRQRTGSITKMGQRDIRRLLVSGAMAVLRAMRYHPSRTYSPWLLRMLVSKPKLVVVTALANRMARVLWAITVHNTAYDPLKSPIG